jgi:polysaccharide export outer membrane protein
MKIPLLIGFLILAASCPLVAQTTVQPVAQAALRPGDTFELRMGGVPNDDQAAISQTYSLDGDGCVNLAYLGKVKVGGLAPGEIQTLIERSYVDHGIFTHPSVVLTIAPQARFVNVGGQVKAPGRIPYTPDMTVFSAINAAGDFNEFAAQTKVRLLRGDKVTVINCKRIRDDPSQDVKVLPGDSIQVPEAFW